MSDGPFTVFAPDNHAFAKIDAKTLEFLLKPENKAELAKILTYHVVAGHLTVAHLKDKQVLTTVQGGKLIVKKTFKKMKGKYYSTITLTDEQGNKSTLTTRNIHQKNGVVHVIDTVLMPMAKEVKKDDMVPAKKDIVTTAASVPTLSTLVVAVKAAGLVETLMSKGPFTVFAPDNNAFAKIDAKTIEFLLKPENKTALVKILTYHVVAGTVASKDLKDGQVITTVQGGKLTVSIKDGKVMLTDEMGGVSTVTTADLYQSNGIVHVINTVVMPK
jgi:transforming growth factor-beta-induced protein